MGALLFASLLLCASAGLPWAGAVAPVQGWTYAVHRPQHVTRTVDEEFPFTELPTPSLTIDIKQPEAHAARGQEDARSERVPHEPEVHGGPTDAGSAAHEPLEALEHRDEEHQEREEEDELLLMVEQAQGRATWHAAAQAVQTLRTHHFDLSQAMQDVQQVSASSMGELQSLQQTVQQLHDQVADVAAQQAQLAAALVEQLGELTLAKAQATAALNLAAAAGLQEHMTRVWGQLAAAHVRETQALEDADALADVLLSLQLAQAQVQEDLSGSLRVLSDTAQDVSRQLSSQAQQLQEEAHLSAQQQQQVEQQAHHAGSGLAVRQQLGWLTRLALHKLQMASTALDHARSHFQHVWRHELEGAQQHALMEALAATTRTQLDDLVWRRDVAVAADAYLEADASQASLTHLQQVLDALTAALPPASAVSDEPSTATGQLHEAQQAQQAAVEAGVARGTQRQAHPPAVDHDEQHKQLVTHALRAYHHQLAEQRDASATLAQLELLRQQLVLAQVSPEVAMREVSKVKELLTQA